MNIKIKPKEEILYYPIGLFKRIPKDKCKYEFGWHDIIRPLLIIIISTYFLFFFFNYIGVIFSILLTVLFEISENRQFDGLLENISNKKLFRIQKKEFLPLYKNNIWQKINSGLLFLLTFFIIFDLILFLIWIF